MVSKLRARTKARIDAVEMFYAYSFGAYDPDEIIEKYYKYNNYKLDNKQRDFAKKLFLQTCKNSETIDKYIKKYLKKNWTIDRIGYVELSILRVAISEFLYFDTPFFAILDEYVSIASTYTDSQVTNFVNALLDNFKNEYRIVDGREG